MSIHSSVVLLTVVALSSGLAHAGVVSGQVRDNQGNPVPHATFAVEMMSSTDQPIVSGGFTDANGNFTTTITPNGEYRITILPQPAPQSLVVTERFENITVGNTPNNLGTIVLEVGALLTGRVLNSSGTPLVGVSLDFVRGPDFQPLDFSNPDTNTQGYFAVAVPFGPCDVRFTPGAPPYYGGPGSASLSISLDTTGPADLGNVILPPGFGLSANVRSASSGDVIEGLELQVVDAATGAVVFTPKNRTDEFGNVSVTVVAGTYHVRFMPDFGDGLAPKEIRNVTTPPGTSLGVIQLLDGFELEGKARGPGNVGCVGAKVSLTDAATNAPVYIINDVTALGGNYKTIVPPGVYDVTFSPPYSEPLGAVTYSDIVIDQDITLDGALPAVPFFTTVGVGVAGLGDVTPVISASGGTPRLGNAAYRLEFSQTRGAANGVVIYSILSASNPLPSPMQIAPPMVRRYVTLGGAPGVAGAGSGSFAMPIDDDPAFAGHLLRAWLLVRDGAAAGGLSSTNELRATITP